MATEGKSYLPPEAERAATGRRLRATRMALGLTQKNVYEAIGLNKQTYNNYETGLSRPNIEDGIRIAVRFGFGLQWLYLGDYSGLSYQLAEKVKEILHTAS